MLSILDMKFSAAMPGKPNRLTLRLSTTKMCCLEDLHLCEIFASNCPTTLSDWLSGLEETCLVSLVLAFPNSHSTCRILQ